MKIKILLLGGWLILLAGLALADITIDNYQVDGYASSANAIEQGATVKVTVRYTNTTGGDKTIVGAKFYLDFNPAVLTLNSISDKLALVLPSATNSDFTPAAGQIRYQRDAAGGAGLTVNNNAQQECLTAVFLVAASAKTGPQKLIWWLTPVIENAKLVIVNNVNVTGNISPFANFDIKASAVPTFGGVNTVSQVLTGNSLKVDWTSNYNAATDLDSPPNGAASYYEGHNGNHNGAGLRYVIKRNGNEIQGDFAGSSFTDSGLADGTPYQYVVDAKDACSPPNVKNTIQSASVFSIDHTPPGSPTDPKFTAGNQQVTLDWKAPAGDPADEIGGYLIIRYALAPAQPPILLGAKEKDQENKGQINGDEYPVGTAINGGTVIYNEKSITFTDTGADLLDKALVNGKTYLYQIITYDTVGGTPNQQGRNYSPPANLPATPGINPLPVSNVIVNAGVNPGDISVTWDNPTDPGNNPQGGTILFNTDDKAKLSAIPENPADWLDPAKMTGISLFAAEALGKETQTILKTLTKNTNYYFKLFTYNAGTPLALADNLPSPAFINAHKFSAGVVAASKSMWDMPETLQQTDLNLTPGINTFSLSFPGPWYACTTNGQPISATPDLLAGKAPITNAAELVQVIEALAGAGTVTAFGTWDNAGKQEAGVTANEGNMPAALAKIIFTDSGSNKEAYQVYLSQPAAFRIRNKPL